MRTTEFPVGFMTQYAPSMVVAEPSHQDLATGLPDRQAVQVGAGRAGVRRQPAAPRPPATADGRWRIYVFADAARAGEARRRGLRRVARERRRIADRRTPAGADRDAWFDVKVDLPAGPRRRRHRRRPDGVPAAHRAVRARRLREGVRRRPGARTSSSCGASTAPGSSSWCVPTSTSRRAAADGDGRARRVLPADPVVEGARHGVTLTARSRAHA